MTGRFAGRTVVVTGAGSGIGFELARLFRDEGAIVYAADLRPEGAPEGTTPITVDVAAEASVRAMIARAAGETGRLDVLCNNAGTESVTDPVACTAAEWDKVFAVNARGVFLGTKHVLPIMLRQRKGAIVNTASVAGLVGLADRAAYCASKGAVIAFTKQVAVQYAGTGVRCNCVCPGTVDSPWVDRLLSGQEHPEQARERLADRQPVGRLGTPAEVAKAVLYLASDDADFVTGSALVIDGGLVAA